jgi:hypothetical protein
MGSMVAARPTPHRGALPRGARRAYRREMRARAPVAALVAIAATLAACGGDRHLASTLRDTDWACPSAEAVQNGRAAEARILAMAVHAGATEADARELVARARRVSRGELDRKIARFCRPLQGMGGG